MVIHETLDEPSTDKKEVINIEDSSSWRSPILRYLHIEQLPEDPKEATKVKKTAIFYTIVNSQLYKRGYSILLLKCIDREQASYVMDKVHEGFCGHHLSGRSLSEKILKAGYYWPTMNADCMRHV